MRNDTGSDHSPCCACSQAAASLILRLWIGLRLFFAGIEKFRAGSGADMSWTLENYKDKMGKIAEVTADNSILPPWICDLYAYPLGFLLVGFGVMCLVGIFTRFSLLVAGLLFVSLAFGLMVLPDDQGSLDLGLHVAITAFALLVCQHDKLTLDRFINRGKK